MSYRDHQFRRFTKADGLPDQKVWRLAADHSGGVWLQAGDSITRLAGGKFSRIWEMAFSSANAIQALQVGADGLLNIVKGKTWLTLSPSADQLKTNYVMESGSDECLTGLPGKSPGNDWAGTTKGLRRWKPGGWEAVGAEDFGRRSVDFIYEDRSTNLWVNTKPGQLFRQNRARWVAVELGDHGVPASTICMEEDREGNLWLGTDHGLVQLQKRRVRAYTSRDGLTDDNAWSVCEGTDETIWVGANQGLSRIQNNRVVPLDPGDVYLDHPDRCVWPARNGGVLIAKSRLGVLEFKDKLTQRIAASALPNPNVFALYADRSAQLWIGTGNGVAAIKDGQAPAAYTNWAGRSRYDVRCIFEDRAGTFWFGTQGQGLTRFREGKFEVFTERDGLSNNRVWSIHEDGEGALWLGTENGLSRYRQGRFFSFTKQHGLLENSVNWILEDDFGYLWLSGLRGIYRVKRELLNDVAEDHARTVQVTAFGTADGMESSETNGEGQPAGWKARDGRLWFPTTRGVVVIDPKTIELNEIPPPVVIEQIKADDEVIFGDGVAADVRRRTSAENRDIRRLTSSATRLSPGRARVVEFHYTANTFVDPKRAPFPLPARWP